MKSLLLLAVCTLAWAAWALAAALQKRARGDPGGTSVLPALPLFPLLAWAAGLGLDRFRPGLGSWTVGGLHAVLALVFLSSSLRDALRLRRGR